MKKLNKRYRVNLSETYSGKFFGTQKAKKSKKKSIKKGLTPALHKILRESLDLQGRNSPRFLSCPSHSYIPILCLQNKFFFKFSAGACSFRYKNQYFINNLENTLMTHCARVRNGSKYVMEVADYLMLNKTARLALNMGF